MARRSSGAIATRQVTFGIQNRTARMRLAELDRHRRAARAARPHPHAVGSAGRVDLAARQHVLRQAADVRAGLHRLAREPSAFPPTTSSARRPVRAHLRGPLDRDHHVGDPGARRADGAALARRLRGMGKFELQVLYARAMTRVWEKIGRLKLLPELWIADFGTRRRHGFLWQDWCVQAMIEGLGAAFLGTSNCLIAMRREVEAIGTNAHELPMVYAALADNDQELAEAPYWCWPTGRRTTTATCASCCPTPTAPQFPRARARLGGVLDRHPHRFGGSDRGRRDGDRLVARAARTRARSSRSSRTASTSTRSSASTAFPRPRARRLRLGHAAHQRLPRARAGRRARSVLHRLQGDLGQRPAGGEALRQPDEGDRAEPPRSSATGACSRSASRRRCRCGVGANGEASEAAPPFHSLFAIRSRRLHEGRHQLRHGRGLRALADGRRRGDAFDRHLGEHRLRLARRRSGHHGPHRRDREEERRRDRGASGLRRSLGLRPARHPRRHDGEPRADDRLPDRRHAGLRGACRPRASRMSRRMARSAT